MTSYPGWDHSDWYLFLKFSSMLLKFSSKVFIEMDLNIDLEKVISRAVQDKYWGLSMAWRCAKTASGKPTLGVSLDG